MTVRLFSYRSPFIRVSNTVLHLHVYQSFEMLPQKIAEELQQSVLNLKAQLYDLEGSSRVVCYPLKFIQRGTELLLSQEIYFLLQKLPWTRPP